MPLATPSKIAESNRVAVHYAQEDTANYGSLPSPASSVVVYTARFTKFDPEVDKKTETSSEIRTDRMLSGAATTELTTKISMENETSLGTTDDFLEGALDSTWTRPMNFLTITGSEVAVASTSTITISSSTDYSPYFKAGNFIKLEGFVNSNNNNYFALASDATFASNVTTLTVTGTPLTIESGTENTTLKDANDVIVQSTSIQTDSTGITGGGSAIFASAVAAGYLKPGQTIYLLGLGYQSGTIVYTGQPAANETISIGGVTYEFVTSGSTPNNSDAVAVTIGAADTDTGTNLTAAIMAEQAKGNATTYATHDTVTKTITVKNGDLKNLTSMSGTVTNYTVNALSAGTPGASGAFEIVSATDTLIKVTPTPDTDANTGSVSVVIKGSHIQPPDSSSIVPKSYEFERIFSDVNAYELWKGVKVDTIKYSFNTGNLATTSIDFMGSKMDVNSAATLSDSATYSNQRIAPNTPIMNSSSNIEAITKNGTRYTCIISKYDLEIKTNLHTRFCLSNNFPFSVGEGSLEVKLDLEAFFDNHDDYKEFLADTYRQITLHAIDLDNNAFIINLPYCFPESHTIPTGKKDDDVIQSISLGAYSKNSSTKNILFSRFSSIFPANI